MKTLAEMSTGELRGLQDRIFELIEEVAKIANLDICDLDIRGPLELLEAIVAELERREA